MKKEDSTYEDKKKIIEEELYKIFIKYIKK